MFERRLRLFLFVLILCVGAILVRAVQVQVLQGEYWRQRAADSMKRFLTTETTRGRILDRNGVVLAYDAPCTDAAVHYRAIVADENWLKAEAIRRLQSRPGSEYPSASRTQRKKLIEAEVNLVRQDLARMWQLLADMSGKSLEDIEQTKLAIRQRVEMRRRFVWWHKYQSALDRHESRDPAPWYTAWMQPGNNAPQIDAFLVPVEEEEQAHTILSAIPTHVEIDLAKLRESLPGLQLVRGKHRVYPLQKVTDAEGNLRQVPAMCHIVGRLSNVSREDIQNDPHPGDPARQYLPNDLIGRQGIEALCEPLLRGVRGQIEKRAGVEQIISASDAAAGQDVRLTIDAGLQAAGHEAFHRRREFRDTMGNLIDIREQMHGAAVVIDVPTGEILALISYPTYDPNQFDTLYPQLRSDEVNKPLLNRATQMALEPGSTAKLVIALAGLAEGAVSFDPAHPVGGETSAIECTGFLVLDNVPYGWVKCWTVALGRQHQLPFKHHPFPQHHPHASGFLNVIDAIERSCNIFFETVADRLTLERVHHWYKILGFGQRVGIGLAESPGRIPDPARMPRASQRMNTWLVGIGQGPVAATPLQVANLSATIGRRGTWIRPTIVRGGPGAGSGPDRAELPIDKRHLDTIHQGMVKVVNSPAGTGVSLWRGDITVAGKTGSAQAAPLKYPQRDEKGKVIRKPVYDSHGRPVGTAIAWNEVPINSLPWYQGGGRERNELTHAWFTGFAPAENPRIAFAVLVEYGGSGGRVAGDVAKDLLEACVEHGYLAPAPKHGN